MHSCIIRCRLFPNKQPSRRSCRTGTRNWRRSRSAATRPAPSSRGWCRNFWPGGCGWYDWV